MVNLLFHVVFEHKIGHTLAVDDRMIQDTMSARLGDFKKHVLHGIAMEVRAECVHDGIEHAVRLHALLPRGFARIPEAIATVENTADVRAKMEADGELVAIAEAVPVVAVAVPEARAVAVIIPTTGI